MEIQGIIINVLEPQKFNTQKGEMVKYGFVLETKTTYPKKIHFQVYGEERWKNMNITQGSLANVSFDLSSREWNGKWYTQCEAWRVVTQVQETQSQNTSSQVKENTAHQSTTNSIDSDLPF